MPDGTTPSPPFTEKSWEECFTSEVLRGRRALQLLLCQKGAKRRKRRTALLVTLFHIYTPTTNIMQKKKNMAQTQPVHVCGEPRTDSSVHIHFYGAPGFCGGPWCDGVRTPPCCASPPLLCCTNYYSRRSSRSVQHPVLDYPCCGLSIYIHVHVSPMFFSTSWKKKRKIIQQYTTSTNTQGTKWSICGSDLHTYTVHSHLRSVVRQMPLFTEWRQGDLYKGYITNIPRILVLVIYRCISSHA